MSTPKREIKPEPTKAPRKRAAPKKAQRVAEVETEPAQTIVAPAATTVTVSEPEQFTLPSVNQQLPDEKSKEQMLEELEELRLKLKGLAAVTAPGHDPLINTEPIVSTLGKIKAWFGKYKVFLIIIAILVVAWFVCGVIIDYQRRSNKAAKETQQTQQQNQDARDRLQLSETNLSAILRKRQADTLEVQAMSAIRAAVDSLKRYDELMTKRNNVLKLQEYELQNKISSASDDDLRRLGSELSGRK